MKKYSDAEIIKMTNDAPKPVREVIENVQTALDIAALGQKHAFHIDKIGMLAELNRNMLLGLVNPQEFLQELITTGIPDKDAREIMTEINQKIFVPLREEMRKGGNAETVKSVAPSVPPRTNVLPPRDTTIPANPNLPPRLVQMNAVVPKYAPPAKYFHLQNKIPPTSPPATKSTVQPPPPHKIQPPSRPIEDSGGVGKLVENRKLLGDHEESHIEFHPTSPTATEGTVKAPNLTTESSLRQVLRTVMTLPHASPKALGVSPETSKDTASPAKPYSSDPYREQIEP